jgi:DNA-binding transcriptional ArsR family regulator
MSPALIHALNHPLRRQVLRLLSKQEAEPTPTGLTKLVSSSLNDLSYHVRVLDDLNVIQQTHIKRIRGSTKHFYISTVADNSLVSQILASTDNDDGEIQRAR